MYRQCIAAYCPGNCCDYYAYCSYPAYGYCYSTVTYYYYDLWWVWLIVGIVCLISAIIACCVWRRRRQRMLQQNTVVIDGNNNTPSYVQGSPVYDGGFAQGK